MELKCGEKIENPKGDKGNQRDNKDSKSTSDSTRKLLPDDSSTREDAERRVVKKDASFNVQCFGNDYGGEPNTDNEQGIGWGRLILWVMVSRRFHKTIMGIKLLNMKIVEKIRKMKLNHQIRLGAVLGSKWIMWAMMFQKRLWNVVGMVRVKVGIWRIT
ncbi:hypothetical protein V6N11_059126 [Hibiscus sabdariffa]|uniref:Uncharacterized protein n=1 Tax=Hibiscus sabdariffa TaxID=183260 RepID=A0ABR2U6G0_9ROSI